MSALSNVKKSWGSLLLIVVSLAAILRALPLILAYLEKLNLLHGASVLLVIAAGLLLFAGGSALLWCFPRAALLALGGVAAVLVIVSGNAFGLLAAAAIAAVTLLAGDAASSLITGESRDERDLPSSFVVGSTFVALLILLLALLRVLNDWTFGLLIVAVLAVTFRRIHPLAIQIRDVIAASTRRRPLLETLWLAFALAAFTATFVIALAPDVSYDGVAYHLPEVRQVARDHRLEPFPDILPQTLFWRSHDTWLSLGYWAGGERATSLLQFLFGLAGVAATIVLAKRLDQRVSSTLVGFAIAAYPFACYQFRATLVDWPAGVIIAAASAELAALPYRNRRAWLAGWLGGAAVATKIFAGLAFPALLLLWWVRSGRQLRHAAAVLVFVLLPLLPWFVWTQSRGGFFLAPYATSATTLVNRLTGGFFFTVNVQRHDDAAQTAAVRESITSPADFVLLPLTLTFASSGYEGFRDGYGGLVALLLMVGLAGWAPRRVAQVVLAAVIALVPWYLMYQPSSRYLLPLFPLYAALTCVGLSRLTRDFEGAAGRAAGVALVVAAIALPVQVGSSGREWKYAAGRLSDDEFLSQSLVSYRFWGSVQPGTNAIFIGEEDRYHAPVNLAWRAEWTPVNQWRDADTWVRGLRALRVEYVVDRARWPLVAPYIEQLRARGTLVPIDRNGEAVLYRVAQNSSQPAAGPIE